jgi:hypothetical protein
MLGILIPFSSLLSQYSLNGSAQNLGAEEFQLTSPVNYDRGSVWNNNLISLNQNFTICTKLYFGSTDVAGADGMAFVLQTVGTNALGNEGAGLGYHTISPSFIVEFDTWSNSDPWFNLGDPVADHLGFMSMGNAYHNSPTALAPPVAFAMNIEDGQYHDATFSWNATTRTFTVTIFGTTYSYSGDIINTIFGGNSMVYWGFTASTGSTIGNIHKVKIVPCPTPCTNDNVPPQITCPAGPIYHCYSDNCSYMVPAVTATDNCGIDKITYVVTGATNRSGTGNNASGCFNPGTSTITYTVKDKNGNTASCTVQVIVKKLTITVPDAYAVRPGGKPNTIYIGYGPNSLTLTANAEGGTAPYTYQWSTGATTQSISVSCSTPGEHSYTVTVTDAKGCKAIKVIKVKCKDVRCGGLNGNNKKDHKVMVCHVPPGNPANAHVICIDYHAVPAHLAHGCYLGECDGVPDQPTSSRTIPAEIADEAINSSEALIQPNPTSGMFEVRLQNNTTGASQITITNANGLTVESRKVNLQGKGQVLKFDLSRQPAGVYLMKLTSAEGTLVERFVIQK